MKNQNGQVAVEFILLSVVMIAMTIAVVREIRTRGVLGKMVSGPWASLAGLIENGVPGPTNNTRSLHPNHHERHLSLQGDKL